MIADKEMIVMYGFLLKKDVTIKSTAINTALKTLGLKTFINRNNSSDIIRSILMVLNVSLIFRNAKYKNAPMNAT